jgi:hypothetical protein
MAMVKHPLKVSCHAGTPATLRIRAIKSASITQTTSLERSYTMPKSLYTLRTIFGFRPVFVLWTIPWRTSTVRALLDPAECSAGRRLEDCSLVCDSPTRMHRTLKPDRHVSRVLGCREWRVATSACRTLLTRFLLVSQPLLDSKHQASGSIPCVRYSITGSH